MKENSKPVAAQGQQDQTELVGLLRKIPLAIVAAVIIGIIIYARYKIRQSAPDIYTSNYEALEITIIIGFTAMGGYVIGGIICKTIDSKLFINKTKYSTTLTSIDKTITSLNENQFLTLTTSFMGLYLLLYFEGVGALKLRPDTAFGWPISVPIIIITAATISAMAFFSVRYTGYIKMTKRLESALIHRRSVTVIRTLRNAVFRDEQLYEPPGNAFVTIGITATFLGLAIGLVALDLPSLFASAPESNEMANGALTALDTGPAAEAAETARRDRATSSLTAFVGCMGLALGMSMLGVTTALAAQWLRGYGATDSTERLLARADQYIIDSRSRGGEPTSPDAG